jgi:hypothetical protein
MVWKHWQVIKWQDSALTCLAWDRVDILQYTHNTCIEAFSIILSYIGVHLVLGKVVLVKQARKFILHYSTTVLWIIVNYVRLLLQRLNCKRNILKAWIKGDYTFVKHPCSPAVLGLTIDPVTIDIDWSYRILKDDFSNKFNVRFEVLLAVTMKNAVFSDIKTHFVLHRRHITSPLQRSAS